MVREEEGGDKRGEVINGERRKKVRIRGER